MPEVDNEAEEPEESAEKAASDSEDAATISRDTEEAESSEDIDQSDEDEPDEAATEAEQHTDSDRDDPASPEFLSQSSESGIGLLRDPDAAERGDSTDPDSSADEFLGGATAAPVEADGDEVVVVNIMFDRDIDDAAVDALTGKGFEVYEKFDVFPIITGGIAASRVAELSSIDGVSSVEENRELGPA